MSAAVAHRNSPRTSHASSLYNNSMDNKAGVHIKIQNEEKSKPESTQPLGRSITIKQSPPGTAQSSTQQRPAIDPAILDPNQADAQPDASTKESPEAKEGKESRVATGSDAAKALAPPPRPGQGQQNQTSDGDYFSGAHNNNSHFNLEPNPFEQSFGQPSGETPGKGLLPPVASITSPAPLTGGAQAGSGFNWPSSLRSGPLSPAMLGGPVGSGTDYFGEGFKGGFPTPNESSLRTGLTPGGTGSMFPAPSPNSQALYNSLTGGGATPSTLDFQKTAMNAAAAKKLETSGAGVTTAKEARAPVAPMSQSTTANGPNSLDQQDAANGLFMLANATQGVQNNQFAVPQQPAAVNTSQPQSQETSPTVGRRGGRIQNGSIGSSGHGFSGLSGESEEEDSKPATRNRGKRTNTGRSTGTANGRRKTEETPPKQPANKKARTQAQSLSGGDSDEEMDIKEEQYHADGKKMTDEDKRKNFLERNRVAALKCRQRKKQWLANLQAKVEIFSSENDSLNATVNTLREEVNALRHVLSQHKDCPISQAQGLGNYFQQHEYPQPQQANPYGMGMNGQQNMRS